jgi:hypothetical protein
MPQNSTFATAVSFLVFIPLVVLMRVTLGAPLVAIGWSVGRVLATYKASKLKREEQAKRRKLD